MLFRIRPQMPDRPDIDDFIFDDDNCPQKSEE